MLNNQCPKCGSSKIMAKLDLIDHAAHGPVPFAVNIEEPEPPKHSFIWMAKSSSGAIRAWICGSCGYTELYTDNFEALWESYRKRHP